jgi:hypothetical protein
MIIGQLFYFYNAHHNFMPDGYNELSKEIRKIQLINKVHVKIGSTAGNSRTESDSGNGRFLEGIIQSIIRADPVDLLQGNNIHQVAITELGAKTSNRVSRIFMIVSRYWSHTWFL